MLSWEYPPEFVGGLGRHVVNLSRELSSLGHDVTVLTRKSAGEACVEEDGRVHLVRAVPYALHPPDFVTWVAELNVAMIEAAGKFLHVGDFDVIHAHDWIVAYAARALKSVFEKPLIATIHATECGRQNGIHNSVQAHISETEWWLCYEAWRVITCSAYMMAEVRAVFNVPADKIRVIPNGVDGSWFEVGRKNESSPLILYVGRLVPEKGPQILIDSMRYICAEFPSARLVFAGDGPMFEELKRQVSVLGLGDRVSLPGQLGDKELRELYGRAWVAVYPSTYEPFGIVALEAMASGVPCVVADVGGLSEIVEHGRTGLKVPPGDPYILAEAVKSLFRDDLLRERLVKEARECARSRYSWNDIAAKTVEVYEEVTGEGGKTVETDEAVAGET